MDEHEDYWKEQGTPAREAFRQLLERIEYNYILRFEVYKLEQAIGKKSPEKRERKKPIDHEKMLADAIEEGNKMRELS